MRFLVDAQLPAELARWLTRVGHDGKHVSDFGLSAASDSVIWNLALENGYIVVTKDEDFMRRRIVAKSGPNILWVRFPNTRKPQLIERFSALMPLIVSAFDRGEILVEIV